MNQSTMRSTLRDQAGLLCKHLEADPAVIFILDEGLRITYCNQSWDRFASENGGSGLERERMEGRSYVAAIPRPLKQFYEEAFERALTTREVWEHCYECSSPEMYRMFRMTTYPDPEGTGLVVVNSLAVEGPHEAAERQEHAADSLVYIDEDDTITMCCHCRRSRRVEQREVWDWVPAYLNEAPVRVSHDICTVCMTLHYPDYLER